MSTSIFSDIDDTAVTGADTLDLTVGGFSILLVADVVVVDGGGFTADDWMSSSQFDCTCCFAAVRPLLPNRAGLFVVVVVRGKSGNGDSLIVMVDTISLSSFPPIDLLVDLDDGNGDDFFLP